MRSCTVRGRVRIYSAISLAVILFSFLPASIAWTKPLTYTIADTTGDWGYPSPYRRYPRGPGYLRMSFIFDTLTWKNGAGEVVPALAVRWEYLDKENAYVFHLNRNAQWHDGEPFTAEDVAFTVQYIRKYPMAWIDPKIIGSTLTLGPHTVKFVLRERYAPFLTNIAGTMPIIPGHIWKDVTDPRRFNGEKALVGTGPFRLLDYNKAQGTYLYGANNDYYGGRPKADRIQFIKVSAEMAAAALKRGFVDAAPIPPDLAEDMKRAGFRVIRAPYGWHLKLVMNHRDPPLDEKAFRQALAYAIDRKGLVEITQRGHGMVGNPGFIPPDNHWFNPRVKQYEFDLDRAKRLLRELGYEIRDGKLSRDGAPLKLEMLTQPGFKEVGLFLKKQLERLGVETDLRSLEAKTLDSKVLHWRFQLAISGHGGLYEPSFLKRAILDEEFNSVRYRTNQELTELVMGQLGEMDTTKRKEIVFRIQELYAEDLPNLPLFYPNWYWAHNERIHLFYTRNGVAIGIPLPMNKLAFIGKEK
jgi:peptide/nickel transport system substrate-binding protein